MFEMLSSAFPRRFATTEQPSEPNGSYVVPRLPKEHLAISNVSSQDFGEQMQAESSDISLSTYLSRSEIHPNM